MSFRLRYIQVVKVKKQIGETIFIGVHCQINWRPVLFPLCSLDELLIPSDPLFRLQYDYIVW
jgi:hypothetical protein